MNRNWQTRDLCDLFNALESNALPWNTRQFTNDATECYTDRLQIVKLHPHFHGIDKREQINRRRRGNHHRIQFKTAPKRKPNLPPNNNDSIPKTDPKKTEKPWISNIPNWWYYKQIHPPSPPYDGYIWFFLSGDAACELSDWAISKQFHRVAPGVLVGFMDKYEITIRFFDCPGSDSYTVGLSGR